MKKENRTEQDVLMEAVENGISVTDSYRYEGYDTILLTRQSDGEELKMMRKIPGRSWTLKGDCVPKWLKLMDYKAQYLKAMELAISILMQYKRP
jgi:hypothetical protein